MWRAVERKFRRRTCVRMRTWQNVMWWRKLQHPYPHTHTHTLAGHKLCMQIPRFLIWTSSYFAYGSIVAWQRTLSVSHHITFDAITVHRCSQCLQLSIRTTTCTASVRRCMLIRYTEQGHIFFFCVCSIFAFCCLFDQLLKLRWLFHSHAISVRRRRIEHRN